MGQLPSRHVVAIARDSNCRKPLWTLQSYKHALSSKLPILTPMALAVLSVLASTSLAVRSYRAPAPRMRRACSRRAVHINVPARSLPAGPPSFPSPSPPLPAARACSAPLPHASVQVLIHAADGTLLQRFRPCEHALGVKCFVWSPTAHLLALASARDLRVRLLNSLTWQRVAEFDLGAGELTEHRTAEHFHCFGE